VEGAEPLGHVTPAAGDGRLAYAMLGRGPDVALVHGLGGCHLNWMRVAPLLAESRRVIVPDLPGFDVTLDASATWNTTHSAQIVVDPTNPTFHQCRTDNGASAPAGGAARIDRRELAVVQRSRRLRPARQRDAAWKRGPTP
jgi:hypothetical protein